MEALGLATQTMFAELIQRALDADFDETFDERGHFTRNRIDGPLYWYYQRKVAGKMQRKYVGPVRDKAINERVKKFNDIKSDFKQRRNMVRALMALGIEPPDSITGNVIEALWKAGFFRLRGVLVGTTAFQTYSGILGIKLKGSSLMTQDLDAAQFYDISHKVGDSMPPILDVLHTIDESFNPIPDLTHPTRVTRFKSKKLGYMVEFLTPNRGSNYHAGKPSDMPALGGASAKPLRYLDFLIHNPIRSVVLHKGGIPVNVPAPERYAIHKLILVTERDHNPAKIPKDIMQSEQIIRAMIAQQGFSLYEAFDEAWKRGKAWRERLKQGINMMDHDIRNDFIFTMQSFGWAGRGLKVSNIPKKSAKKGRKKSKS